MYLKYFVFGLLSCLYYHSINCKTESVKECVDVILRGFSCARIQPSLGNKGIVITYFSTERPAIDWYDTKLLRNVTVLSRRVSRQDPKHYVELYVHTLFTITNSLKVDFYFYQFLTNRYRPSFVEMHFSFCDMLHSDPIFGQTMRNALGGRECPYSPGEYYLKNLSIPYVPQSFPFPKGRIYCNVSLSKGGASKHIARGSIDMEIKVAKINNNK